MQLVPSFVNMLLLFGVCAVFAHSSRDDPYVITLAADASPGEKYAASELANFTGCAVVSPGAAASAPQLAVGFGAATALGVGAAALDNATLGDEGFLLTSEGLSQHQSIALSGAEGAPRGALYAAYRAATTLLGMRFWAHDETTQPNLVLPLTPAALAPQLALGVHDRVVPELEYRDCNAAGVRLHKRWALRNHYNGIGLADAAHGGSISYATPPGFVHTSYTLLSDAAPQGRGPPADLFAAHNEWFWPHNDSQAYGQLCWTNASLVEFLKQRVRHAINASLVRNGALPDIVSVSQNDNFNYCKDPAEQAVIDEEGSPIGPLLRAVNAVADDIAADFPSVAIDTLAYQYTRPAPKITKPRPNVIIRLCSIECNFAQPLSDPSNAAFQTDIINWSKISQRTYVWDYVTNFGNYIAPFPNYYVLVPNAVFFAQHGVRGLFEEGAYQGPGAELAELKDFLMAAALWDPVGAATPDDGRALISGFLAAYYGSAAHGVQTYMDAFHASARTYYMHENFAMDAPFLTPAALLTAGNALADAQPLVAKDAARSARLDRVLLGVAYVVLLRWDEVRTYAKVNSTPWPLLATKDDAFDEFVRVYNATGITHLSESGHDLAWYRTQVFK